VVRTLAAAETVPEVGRAREAAAPRAAVLADLVQRLDHQRVLADALGHRRQLALLDQLHELRRLLERLGSLRGIRHDLRPFQLPDQALAGVLSDGRGRDDTGERPHREGNRELRSEGTGLH